MRWLFLLLLLLNVTFFIWQHNPPSQPSATFSPPADSAVKSLTLLSEEAPTSTPSSQPEAAPAEACHAVGPFSTAEDAQRTNARLAEQNIQSQQRADETSQPPQWWLDIQGPPLPARIWQELTQAFSGLGQQPCP